MADRTAPAQTNLVEYTVSELAFALRRTVEDAYGLVKLRGEISGFKGRHSSGHCYFTLKDEGACIEAVIWRSTFQRLKFKPGEGLEVVAKGRITTYPDRSKYQIVIDELEPAGVGALLAQLEERKRRLAAEGLFDQARKRPLPFLPRIIGVITSPTGAVIRDILHRLEDRFPSHVLLWPVRVQGETCALEVSAAVFGFNRFDGRGTIPRPDLIIVARGGGSLEDLWGFNDERVARAVAASTIPLISAVGHETDWTIIDLVADFRDLQLVRRFVAELFGLDRAFRLVADVDDHFVAEDVEHPATHNAVGLEDLRFRRQPVGLAFKCFECLIDVRLGNVELSEQIAIHHNEILSFPR